MGEGGGREAGGAMEALNTRWGGSINQRTIPHLCLSEAIYLRKWGRFHPYVRPPDLFSHFTHQREHHPAADIPGERGCRNLEDFQRFALSMPGVIWTHRDGGIKKEEKLNDIFDAMNIWHSRCGWPHALRLLILCRCPCCCMFSPFLSPQRLLQ